MHLSARVFRALTIVWENLEFASPTIFHGHLHFSCANAFSNPQNSCCSKWGRKLERKVSINRLKGRARRNLRKIHRFPFQLKDHNSQTASSATSSGKVNT